MSDEEDYILPAFVDYPYQFTVGDRVIWDRFGKSVIFEVKEVLHTRTGDVRLVLSSGHGSIELASECELSFA